MNKIMRPIAPGLAVEIRQPTGRAHETARFAIALTVPSHFPGKRTAIAYWNRAGVWGLLGKEGMAKFATPEAAEAFLRGLEKQWKRKGAV